MNILGIDTTCDDTSISVVQAKKGKFKVKSNIVSSQVELHKKYGGVYPSVAKREHQKNLVPVLGKALEEAGLLKEGSSKVKEKELKKILEREETLLKRFKKFLKNFQKPKIDIIAVAYGPGLEPCLWVGTNFTKALSYSWGIPSIPVNHIEAHILSVLLENKSKEVFPSITLVVSGGHTQLILVKGIGDYKILGETRDDAAGECFDKTARIIGLPYPGGPAIQKLAKEKSTSTKIKLPRPMLKTKDYDFSFSGLKTAVLYDFKKRNKDTRNSKDYQTEVAKEIQESITDVLTSKTIKAAKQYKVKSITLGGGVSANQKLRGKLKEKTKDFQLYFPKRNFCTDNGAMIAIAGYYNREKKTSWKKLSVDANLRIK